ncbi:MAG: AAA family ATPase [Pseudomonadales bacterium]|jgi:general secretion pathway protein A|nr:AAA family ATPase [Pseudomonadales bacterium]
MYQKHFGLDAPPFSIAPDPAFLFLSDAHNEALAHLMYGFSHGGFVLITGEVGTGKTTLLRNLLDRTPPELDVAFILNPRLTVRELLETVCDELGVAYGPAPLQSVKQYIDVLNKHLLKTHISGRSTVIIIDEAQNLSPAVLEQIRLLTNLETNDKKLLRIILLGQPELGDMLNRTELRQLAQRITARYHLTPLSKEDVHAYVNHRLTTAGGSPNIFTNQALNALYRLSKGTPRLINVIADRALLGAYVEGKYQVSAAMVRNGAREVFGQKPRHPQSRYYLGAGLLICLVALAMSWAYLTRHQTPAVTQSSATQPTAQNGTAEELTQRQATTTSPSAVADPGNVTDTQTDNSAEIIDQPAERDTVTAPATLTRPPGRTFELQRAAYRAVFAAWSADYNLDNNQIPCDFAPQVGLQCLSRNGSWSEVTSLNSPVILELWDTQESPYYAALLGYDGELYRLRLGQQDISVSPRDLRDAWFGTYVLIWQTPPGYSGSLRQGDDHPTVAWLRARLEELDYPAPTASTDSYFDDTLVAAVTAFQNSEGLLADGIVGPLTWIRLSDRLNLPAPTLRS